MSHHSIHISPPSTFRKMHLSFIQVPSDPIQAPRFVSHLHQGPISLPSTSQDLHLTRIQVPPHHLIQDPRFASLLHLCHVSPPVSSPGLQLTCIQVPSHSIQVPKFVSHLHPVHASSPSRSWYSCHIFIQVTSCLHPGPDPGPKNGISAPSKSHLSLPRTRDFSFISIQVTLHLNSGPRIHVSLSPPSMSRLTAIQVPRFTPHLYPGPVSLHPPSQLNLWLTSIQFVSSHLHPELDLNA